MDGNNKRGIETRIEKEKLNLEYTHKLFIDVAKLCLLSANIADVAESCFNIYNKFFVQIILKC